MNKRRLGIYDDSDGQDMGYYLEDKRNARKNRGKVRREEDEMKVDAFKSFMKSLTEDRDHEKAMRHLGSYLDYDGRRSRRDDDDDDDDDDDYGDRYDSFETSGQYETRGRLDKSVRKDERSERKKRKNYEEEDDWYDDGEGDDDYALEDTRQYEDDRPMGYNRRLLKAKNRVLRYTNGAYDDDKTDYLKDRLEQNAQYYRR